MHFPREWNRNAVSHPSRSGFCCRAEHRLQLILLPDSPPEGIEINKSEYAKRWPFAMAQGRLRCEGAGAVILTVRGTDYAVNGMASNRYRPIQAVMTDPKIDIGPIISRGLTLCKW
jgi:hypothetical protein